MITLCVMLSMLLAPQGESRPGTTSRPVAATVHTDAHGWPAAPNETPADPTHAEVELDLPPQQPDRAGGHAEIELLSGPLPAGPSALHPSSLNSPLRGLWTAIGQPADMASERGARAHIKLHLFDSSGREVATRVLVHDVDLRAADRDRLEFADGRKVYGRDGNAVWALIDNVVWHSHEQEAREILSVLGVLMRSPWIFQGADFRVFPRETITERGETKQRIRIERKPVDEAEQIGPMPGESPTDRFELVFGPGMDMPEELRYRLAGGTQQRRVELREYQALRSGLRVPVRRVFRSESGTNLMEMEIVSMSYGVDFPTDRFRPPVR